MWPKLLDMSRDECRGMLRRLELESYSSVVGTFRAQGILNDVKSKILKDLREAFHISDDRHKAEVRRVVNNEAFSTIAKAIYGPNSEIEWHREGSRGFSILHRSTPQTALTPTADKAAELGDALNAKLPPPSSTTRDRTLSTSDDSCAENSKNIILTDPVKLGNKALTSTDNGVNSLADLGSAMKSRKRGASKLAVNLPMTNSKSPQSPKKPLAAALGKRIGLQNKRRRSEIFTESPTIVKPLLLHRKADRVNEITETSTPKVSVPHDAEKQPIIHRYLPTTDHNQDEQLQDSVQASTETQNSFVNVARPHIPTAAKVQFISAPTANSSPLITTVPKMVEVPSKRQITPRVVKFADMDTVVVSAQSPLPQKQHQLPPKASIPIIAPQAFIKKPSIQINASTASTSQINSNQIPAAFKTASMTQPPKRVPPKINILSQQTITKSNINFLPLNDSKFIIQSDAKLANVLKTQQIQVLPPTSVKSNMIIRGTNAKVNSSPSIIRSMPISVVSAPTYESSTANSNNVRAEAVANMPKSITVHSNQIITNNIVDSSPIDMMDADTTDYIIEETTGYEVTADNEHHLHNNVAYLSTADETATPAKIAKLENNLVHTAAFNTKPYSYAPIKTNNTIIYSPVTSVNKFTSDSIAQHTIEPQTVVYEEQVEEATDWEYETDQNKFVIEETVDSNGSAVDHVVYAEVIDDNDLTEEYVTTEIFPPNDNDIIEMEIGSVNHDGRSIGRA